MTTPIGNAHTPTPPAQVQDVVTPPAYRTDVTAVPRNRPSALSLPDATVFSASLADQIASLPSIGNASDLDTIVDGLHGYILAHDADGNAAISGISTAFAKVEDTKLFAICRRWEDKYPADRSSILTSLNGVWRSGTPEGFGPVRELSGAYEVISGSIGIATMLAGSNPKGQRPDIVGLYNASSLWDILNVYFDSEGRTINGYTRNSDGLATQFLISVPPTASRQENGERNFIPERPGQEYPEDLKQPKDRVDKEAVRAKLEYLGIPWESVYSDPERKNSIESSNASLKKTREKIIPPDSLAERADGSDITGSFADQGAIPDSVEGILSDILDLTADPLAEPNVIEDVVPGAEEMPFDGIQPKN